MKLVIENKEYSLPYGIMLLKTLHGDDYNNLSEDFKHEEIEKVWEKHKAIPKKLYVMSKSQDPETLELCCKMLDEKKVKHYKEHINIWGTTGIKENVLHRVKIFLTIEEEKWNNYK